MAGINRRSFLKAAAAQSVLLGSRAGRAAAAYTVGVGHSSDPYTAAQTAIAASGQFPSAQMAGKTVIIKPNLVKGYPSTTGMTTDPQVVRAAVDQSLAAGAAQILIAEGSCQQPAPFTECGYDFFLSYDPQGRIQLVDLCRQPVQLVVVNGGLAYHQMWLPNTVLDSGAIFISAAKMKTHGLAGATLSMKNLVGMAPPTLYHVDGRFPRQDLHNRGIAEAIIDLNLVRPIHFALIDGIWGMEGQGPLNGDPIEADLVVAGLNRVAVDLVGLYAMQIPESTVPYLTYARSKGMGPASVQEVTITGDAFTPLAFVPAILTPTIWRPVAKPDSLAPGQQASISYSIPQACDTRFEIVQDNDKQPGLTLVRTLHDWTARAAGQETMAWDGTTDAGAAAGPGWYLARVQARYSVDAHINYASSFIRITG